MIFISILQPIIKSGKNHYACCRGIFSTPSIDIRGDTKSESKILFGRFSSLILNNLIKDWIRNSEFRFREGLMNTKKRSYYSDLKSLIRNSWNFIVRNQLNLIVTGIETILMRDKRIWSDRSLDPLNSCSCTHSLN